LLVTSRSGALADVVDDVQGPPPHLDGDAADVLAQDAERDSPLRNSIAVIIDG
jgi:hypothetical protein